MRYSFCTNTQLFTSQDINWWIGVVWITCESLWCFYQLFGLSFWRHPFTAEDPLMSKWRNAKFLQIYSDKETNSVLDCTEDDIFLANFNFWVNYSFKCYISFISKFTTFMCMLCINNYIFKGDQAVMPDEIFLNMKCERLPTLKGNFVGRWMKPWQLHLYRNMSWHSRGIM